VFVLRQNLIKGGHFCRAVPPIKTTIQPRHSWAKRIRSKLADKPAQASRGSVGPRSRRLSHSFVHQQYRYVVADRIHTAALTALQALNSVFEHQRLLADRANQYVEKVLGNHGGYFTPNSESAGLGFECEVEPADRDVTLSRAQACPTGTCLYPQK